jgi:ADP-heptose:LPS heptosyltransferase
MANLFILPNFLGDTILTTGLIKYFQDEPAVLVVNKVTAPLFQDTPNIERLIFMQRKPWNGHWIDLWKKLRGSRWDRLIDFKGSALPFVLKAQEKRLWRQPDGSIPKVVHISRCLGFQETLSPYLWISPSRLEHAQKTLQNRPTLSVAPVANWNGKQWPLERYITLLNNFCKTYPDAQIAVYAAPHEKNQVEPLLKALPKDQCLNTIGGDLLDSAALIKASRLFLGNDSGLMHLSAALDTPTIGLFGPSNEKIYGPWSDQTPSPHRTIRGEPFVKHIKQSSEDTNCYMTSLTIPQVWEDVVEVWEMNPKKR